MNKIRHVPYGTGKNRVFSRLFTTHTRLETNLKTRTQSHLRSYSHTHPPHQTRPYHPSPSHKFLDLTEEFTFDYHGRTITASMHELLPLLHSRNRMDYRHELEVASRAVHQASILTNSVQGTIQNKGNSLEKDEFGDPVTIADFASQAFIINAVHHCFPSDTFVGEEDESMLRSEPATLEKVWALISKTQDEFAARGTEEKNSVPRIEGKEDVLRVIGLGGRQETGKGRVWMLDPIDGTATFLKGTQYAVSLALVVDGDQKVGVLGCPNIRAGSESVYEEVVDRDGLGVLLSAVKGHGAFQRAMNREGLGEERKMTLERKVESLRDLRFVNSMASSHISKTAYLGVKKACELASDEEVDLWSMHVKYAALAVGGVDCMVRIPPKRSYHGYVWDHAGGQLIYQEAGGKLTDAEGKEFDFGAGRKLERNWGVVAAPEGVHGKLLDVVREALRRNPID